MKYNQEDIKKAREYYNQKYEEERQKRDCPNIGWNHEKQRMHLALLAYLKKPIPKRILEVGIGKGDLASKVSKQLENQETSYAGIDTSKEGVRIAAEKIEKQNFHFLIADGTCLPFKSDEFDLVICSEVIEHIIEKEKALLEISRVLKVGGQLLLTTPNPKSLTYMLPRMVNKVKKFQYGSNQPVEEHIEREKLAGMLKCMLIFMGVGSC